SVSAVTCLPRTTRILYGGICLGNSSAGIFGLYVTSYPICLSSSRCPSENLSAIRIFITHAPIAVRSDPSPENGQAALYPIDNRDLRQITPAFEPSLLKQL